MITAHESGELVVRLDDGVAVSRRSCGPNLQCMHVRRQPDEELRVVATGGKENLLKIWDMDNETATFTAKNVRCMRGDPSVNSQLR